MSWNLGAQTSWNPLGHTGPVTGLLYLTYLVNGNIYKWACPVVFWRVLLPPLPQFMPHREHNLPQLQRFYLTCCANDVTAVTVRVISTKSDNINKLLWKFETWIFTEIRPFGVSLYHATGIRADTYCEANGLFLQAFWDREQRNRVKLGEERTIKNKVGDENETEEEEYVQKDWERNKKEGN